MDTRRRIALCLPLCLAAMLGAGGATAQAPKPEPEVVLKEGRFTEDDLVNQLDTTPTRNWAHAA